MFYTARSYFAGMGLEEPNFLPATPQFGQQVFTLGIMIRKLFTNPQLLSMIHCLTHRRQLNKNAKGLATAAAVLSPILKCLKVTPSVDSGSYNSLYTIASLDFSVELNGKYFVPVAKVEKPSKFAEDSELATKLWEWTDKEMQAKGFI